MLTGRHVEARIASAEATMTRRYETRNVVVASVDVAQGGVLNRENLALRQIPREYLAPDAVPAERAGELVGNRLAIGIARGMPVSAGALAADGGDALATVLQGTERAVTLPVDDLTSQAGALRAGDFVDLYYGRRDDGDALLVPLLQKVEVLAVGDSFSSGGTAGSAADFSTVTLRLQADEAPRVVLAQQAGDITLLLRGRDDQALQASRVLNSRELLRVTPTRTVQAGVEVLTGGQGGAAPARSWLRVGSGAGSDAS
jgi:pilus assembly protein CpaB